VFFASREGKEMPLRLRSRISRMLGCTIALLVVLVPFHALADEPLIEGAGVAAPTGAVNNLVEPMTVVVEEVVEPSAEVVEEVVEPPAEVANDVEEAAEGAVGDVGDATAEVVTEAPTVEETEEAAGNASGQVQENVNAAVSETSQNGEGATGAIAGDRSEGAGTDASAGGGKSTSGVKERPQDDRQAAERIEIASTGPAWRRMHFARLGVAVPATSFPYQPMTLPGGPAGEPEVDPCEDDPGLACLGLLFGIGEFAEAGGDVLGLFLAATGVALRGLIFLALALLLAGVVALSIAPRRATNIEIG
jgi:hypothetical protein